jgi:hypothetical protein
MAITLTATLSIPRVLSLESSLYVLVFPSVNVNMLTHTAQLSHHMESWRFAKTSAKILLLEDSLSAALSMAYGPVHISLNNIPTRAPLHTLIDRRRLSLQDRPMPSQPDLRVVPNGKQRDMREILGMSSMPMPKQLVTNDFGEMSKHGVRMNHGNKPKEHWRVHSSPLIALVCRAIYTECYLGSALEYDDLPESLQPYYYPTSIQDTDDRGLLYLMAKFCRLVLEIDESPTFSVQLAQQIVPSDVMAGITDAVWTPYTSSLWPMFNRISAECLKSAEGDADALRMLGYNFRKQLVLASDAIGKVHHELAIGGWLSSISMRLNTANITVDEYRKQLTYERNKFKRKNDHAGRHATNLARFAGVDGESSDAFKLLTSYAATGKARAHTNDRGKTGESVLTIYGDWIRTTGRDYGPVATARRKADKAMFVAGKDTEWIRVQLSRIAFKDHIEGLPQRFKDMA